MKQTKLSEPSVTKGWPKGHRQSKKKKFFQKDYPIKAKDFDGIIQEAEDLGLDTFMVGYSGGKDSGMVLHKMLNLGKKIRVFHIKTNIGIKITEEFVIDQCQSLGVPLDIREPTPLAFAYVAYCLEFGFPGVNMHSAIMKILKYNTMKKYVQEPQFKNKHPVIVAGVRKLESTRRFKSYNTPITQETELWFVNPLFHYSDEKVYKYFIENGLKRSPTYETLGFSGECMCGSFAQKDEAKIIQQIDPHLFESIQWITEGIKKFGTDRAKKYSKWGNTSDFNEVENQEILEKFFTLDEIKHVKNMIAQTCGEECGAGTMRGSVS